MAADCRSPSPNACGQFSVADRAALGNGTGYLVAEVKRFHLDRTTGRAKGVEAIGTLVKDSPPRGQSVASVASSVGCFTISRGADASWTAESGPAEPAAAVLASARALVFRSSVHTAAAVWRAGDISSLRESVHFTVAR
jgi:hypothetical protein